MKYKSLIALMTMAVLAGNAEASKKNSAKIAAPSNPLTMEWKTPFQTPPFDLIKVSDYLPAFEYAITQARAEINAIVNNKAKPTFDNTIVALDRSGRILTKVAGVFFNVTEAESTDETRLVSRQIIPIMTAYQNDVSLDEALFKRVKAVYDERAQLNLNTEQAMLLEKSYKSFSRNGANLSLTDKDKYRKITEELADLALVFGENALKETQAYTLHITKEEDLSGVPTDVREQAAQKAKAKNLEGYLFDLSQPSYIGFIKYADNRNLRKELYLASNTRAFKGNENDNQVNVKRISELRLQLANLLGYPTYADYVLEERMAENSPKVKAFLADLLKVSLPFAQRDVTELQAYAETLGFNDTIRRWDFPYYSDKLRTEKYNINDNMLKPYFALENVKNGIFALCDSLYGLKFVEAKNITKYHNDVQVYEVLDASGKAMAILYMDFFARPTKRAGAWMTSFREQYKTADGTDVRPLVSLVLNYPAPVGNEPVLLTYDEFSTFLHEFGHALHGMLTECTYQTVSGTNVPRDFVELPSQIMENFGTEKEFLDLFAKHYQTGAPLPLDLIEKLRNAENFQAGYASVRQLMFGLLDMAWHSQSTPTTMNVADFEASAINNAEILPLVEEANTSVVFNHIFAGGYAAGYYGYKWAEVLDADAFSVFKKNGIFDKKTADAFRKNVLAKGGTQKPMELYIMFRGQEPTMEALLERSGMK